MLMANLGLRCNADGLEIVREFEGLYLKAYRNHGDIWTIGYGHTRGVTEGMICTVGQAEAWLLEDIDLAGAVVRHGTDVKLGANQFSALCSFVFNVGAGNFMSSTLLKLLNRRWYEQVPAQLMRWNHQNGEIMGGLTRRRMAEGRLWDRPDIPAAAQLVAGVAT